MRVPSKYRTIIACADHNGADMNDGHGPDGGALYAALLGGQPEEIVGEMIKNGGIISSRAVSLAVEKEHVEILGMLLANFGDVNKLEELLEQAKRQETRISLRSLRSLSPEERKGRSGTNFEVFKNEYVLPSIGPLVTNPDL